MQLLARDAVQIKPPRAVASYTSERWPAGRPAVPDPAVAMLPVPPVTAAPGLSLGKLLFFWHIHCSGTGWALTFLPFPLTVRSVMYPGRNSNENLQTSIKCFGRRTGPKDLGGNKMCFPRTPELPATFSVVCAAGSTFSGSGDQLGCYQGGHHQSRACGRAFGPTKGFRASASLAGSAGEVRLRGRSPASGILFPTLLFHMAVH